MKLKNILGIVYIFLLFVVEAQFLHANSEEVLCYQSSDSIKFIKGADVSFIPQIEDLGGVYKENDTSKDHLDSEITVNF